ncbi:interferon-inducible GTPase 1 [Mesocricetus auratus]|uniref:Interferon-inducible GTPase 1 n=1 Tax=Mesocricetus auratus TaxID=10036 RepID=A0A3Q0CSX4_MESAU|nr:interferon-inducible GTPase 1 [Mesocricetus auratus]XP_040597705.1 interferon-inducible GTPase 1 [Mesocricetus auratus]
MGQSSSDTAKDGGHEDLVSSFTVYLKTMKREKEIISEENIRLIQLHLKKGNIKGANSVISKALKNIDEAPISIALTGESGAGKSSFINALRGVGAEDQGAAKVGVVETTMERTPYKHPRIKTLTLWDLPGIGTINFPPKDYLEEVQFQEYDFFVIVSATRFTKLELELAKAIRFMKKNYYFVRTKVDIDLHNEKKSKPRTFDKENTMAKIRSYCENTFIQNNMDAPQIFLISSSVLSDYGFQILMDTLIKDLPAQKRHNFTLSMTNITDAAIDRKRESMQQTIWLEAFKAGLLATVPAVGILRDDAERLKVKLNHYRVLFGVDDESLEDMAKNSEVPVEQLKEIIKSPYLLETKKEKTLGEIFLKYLEIFASANGGLLAAGLYFGKTFYLHHIFLDAVTEDAKALLRETYSKSSSNSPDPQLLTMNKCYSFLISLTGFVVICFVLFYLDLWEWNNM